MASRRRFVCDQVVLGHARSEVPVTSEHLVALPRRLTAGVDLLNGPPWQLVQPGQGSPTALMHLLLLELDDDPLHPKLGREASNPPSKKDPWVESPLALSRLARERAARWLEPHDQVVLAKGRGKSPGERDREYHAAMITSGLTGYSSLYLHDSAIGHWSAIPEVVRTATGTPVETRRHNEPAASILRRGWGQSLLDPMPHAVEPAPKPLSTSRFGNKLKNNLGIVISGVVNDPLYDPTSPTCTPELFAPVGDSPSEAPTDWLKVCDDQADMAYGNGLSPMLEFYQGIDNNGIQTWRELNRLVDRLRGIPSSTGQAANLGEWTPYGNPRVNFLFEALATIPRPRGKRRPAHIGLVETVKHAGPMRARARLRKKKF